LPPLLLPMDDAASATDENRYLAYYG